MQLMLQFDKTPPLHHNSVISFHISLHCYDNQQNVKRKIKNKNNI